MQKPAVLFVATTFPTSLSSLTPHFMHSLALGLSDQFVVHVLAPHAPGSKRFEQHGNLHVHRFQYAPSIFEKLAYGSGIVHNIKANRWLALLIPGFVISAMILAITLIIRHKVKLVHVNWIVPFGPLFAGLKSVFRFRLIITSLGADLLDLPHSKSFSKSGLNRWVMWSLRKADIVTVLSSPMKNRVETLVNKQKAEVEVIPLGIDFDRFNLNGSRAESGALRLLFVGRLVEVKGCDLLIEALANLRQSGIDLTCTIVGDGHDRAHLEKICRKLGLADKVTFMGQVPNQHIPQIMAEHDVFLVPSRREAFGVVYLEAMAAGMAVITTATDGQADLIEHTIEGFVVDQESISDLASAIANLSANRHLVAQMGTNGQKKAARYNWPEVAAKYARLYDRLMPAQ